MDENYLPVVVGAAVVGDWVLRLLFSDGTVGDVDFSSERRKERRPDQLRLREVEIRCCRSLDRKSLRFSAGGSYGIRDRYGR
jgi:hypothetical protein